MSINFFNEKTNFEPENQQAIQKWISAVINDKGFSQGTINYIFCTDEYLLKLNQQYLDHDTYTDIISFDYSSGKVISGDLFISIDRVKENAESFQKTFLNELHRVMVHGILHLCGHHDKTTEESSLMRKMEDYYLELLVVN